MIITGMNMNPMILFYNKYLIPVAWHMSHDYILCAQLSSFLFLG